MTSLTHAAEIADVREQTYYLLLALTDGPLHGYAIAQRVGELSGGRVTLSAGTLSGALDRLLSQGDLRIDREETVQGRLRRYYRLADPGAAASRRRPTG
ncbi:MAG: PadR family transcriptional regulator [Tetrasphaera sp.]